MFSTGFTSPSVLLLFPLLITFVNMHSFYHNWSNKDEFLPINPPANVFVFGDFKVHHKDCITYSGRIDRLSKLCYNFCISNDVTAIAKFSTRIPDCDSHSLAPLDLFVSWC